MAPLRASTMQASMPPGERRGRGAAWPALLGLLLGLLAGSSARAADEGTIRIGTLAYLGAERSFAEWSPTARAIEAGLPGMRVELVPLDHDGLARAVRAGALDFVITNPGHYVELEVAFGISRIATLEGGPPVAATIVVRRDRSDIARLADLRGKQIAIVGPSAFGGFQAAWRELVEAGIDPFTDVARLDSVGFPMTRVIDAVVSNRVDAGIVRGCVLEQREAEGALAKGALRVLARKPSPLTICAVSSRVYPDWPIARLRSTPPGLAKKVATALLTYTPPPGTPGWTVPVDYQPVHELFRALRIGPYASLRNVTAFELLTLYWQWFAAIVAGLAAWVWHVLRVERLVRRRTVELAAANTSLRDEIDKRRRVEEREALHRRELDHSARLSTLGEMAGGLAHELNQPLAAIANYADGCEFRLRGGEVDRPALVEATRLIRQQADRAAQVIQRMRAFVRKREPVHAETDVNELVIETLEFFEGLARRAGLAIERDLGRGLPPIAADRIQLQQVMLNLLQNALDAMQDARAPRVKVGTEREAGGVRISFADRGTGISDEVIQRLCEPFFTTKPGGLGLGLALCRSIIDEHHGRLEARDNPGGGTVMELWLPAAEGDGGGGGGI